MRGKVVGSGGWDGAVEGGPLVPGPRFFSESENVEVEDQLNQKWSHMKKTCVLWGGVCQETRAMRCRKYSIFQESNSVSICGCSSVSYTGKQVGLRVEVLLKTDSGYPKRCGRFFSFTMANPGSSLRFNTHWSASPVSALARFRGPRKMSQSPVSRNSNIKRRMDRPKAVVGVIRGVA